MLLPGPGKPAVSSSGFLSAKPQGRERLPILACGAGKGEEEVERQDVVEGLPGGPEQKIHLRTFLNRAHQSEITRARTPPQSP